MVDALCICSIVDEHEPVMHAPHGSPELDMPVWIVLEEILVLQLVKPFAQVVADDRELNSLTCMRHKHEGLEAYVVVHHHDAVFGRLIQLLVHDISQREMPVEQSIAISDELIAEVHHDLRDIALGDHLPELIDYVGNLVIELAMPRVELHDLAEAVGNGERKLEVLTLAQETLMIDDVVLHLLEGADEGVALFDGKIAFKYGHKHVDALLGESMR